MQVYNAAPLEAVARLAQTVVPPMAETTDEISRDVRAVQRIDAVPVLLKVLCETTGMGFAAVARVSGESWTACAVHDEIAFGLQPGGQLDVTTTLCRESRELRRPIVIDHASADPAYCDHHTPRIYRIESYVSVPIVLGDDRYFGNLCAIDPRPAKVSDPRVVSMFQHFASLIAMHLANEQSRDEAHAALLDAHEAGELRDQFIAILGHDLRTPLSAVGHQAELLAHQADDPAAVRATASRIGTNVRRMSALIDDVLDFARGRLGGGIGVERASVPDCDAALQAVVAEIQAAYPQRTVEARIDDALACVGDRGRLQQLAANLLANALTHGASDGVVRFTAVRDGGELVIEVWNAGDPIAEGSLRQIFKPFRRAEGSARREGLGLGLHICQQIVQAHGGTLTVRSAAEEGTTFTARLPLAS